jgi:hypothetical protein
LKVGTDVVRCVAENIKLNYWLKIMVLFQGMKVRVTHFTYKTQCLWIGLSDLYQIFDTTPTHFSQKSRKKYESAKNYYQSRQMSQFLNNSSTPDGRSNIWYKSDKPVQRYWVLYDNSIFYSLFCLNFYYWASSCVLGHCNFFLFKK